MTKSTGRPKWLDSEAYRIHRQELGDAYSSGHITLSVISLHAFFEVYDRERDADPDYVEVMDDIEQCRNRAAHRTGYYSRPPLNGEDLNDEGYPDEQWNTTLETAIQTYEDILGIEEEQSLTQLHREDIEEQLYEEEVYRKEAPTTGREYRQLLLEDIMSRDEIPFAASVILSNWLEEYYTETYEGIDIADDFEEAWMDDAEKQVGAFLSVRDNLAHNINNYSNTDQDMFARQAEEIYETLAEIESHDSPR